MSDAKALGFDSLGPGTIRRLPEPGREQRRGLIQYAEEKCVWPGQCSVTRCALAAKPKGGDRAL
eukprot:7986912-Pyramimonas_sp.AAC.1